MLNSTNDAAEHGAALNELQIPHFVIAHTIGVAEQRVVETIEDVRILRDQITETSRVLGHDMGREHDDDFTMFAFEAFTREQSTDEGKCREQRQADTGLLFVRR